MLIYVMSLSDSVYINPKLWKGKVVRMWDINHDLNNAYWRLRSFPVSTWEVMSLCEGF